ncbi:MAG: DoxX family protein [Bacteroidetes bacterium]|nr:DoxX family protein [Bacteroidota bacterium]
MDILIILGLLILGCLLNLAWEPGFGPAIIVARIYLVLSVVLAAMVWLYFFAGIKNTITLRALGVAMQYGGYLGRLMLGFLTGNILFKVWLKDTFEDCSGLKIIIKTTLWAVSVTIANSFLVATVGKSENMPYMIGFFRQSGYAIWFLYFIMAVESVCALGLLLHFKLKTGMYASIGLMLIMLGAVYTHLHNRDPFPDSYAAISELISLLLILLIYYFEKLTPKSPETQIYVV